MRYRFGAFELCAETGELFRDGEKVRLQPQPLQVLTILLARPGELVTRQELITQLWGETSLADSETYLNIAVKKLREALEDSAEKPQMIETLPRRGYRFIGTLISEPPTSEPVLDEVAAVAVRRRMRARWAMIGVAALIGIGAAGWKLISGRVQAFEFHARDTLMVAQISNQTGEPELDGVLEAALESELSASPYLSVASGDRIADILRLMRKPVTPRVPTSLAREVCLRDPGIHAAVGGFIRKVGAGYLLSAEIMSREAEVDSITVTEMAADKNQVLGAVRRLSTEIRRRLGESLPARPGGEVERITTSSLEALKLYSEAMSPARPYNWPAAEIILRRAVQLDPDFASAHIMLAWAVHNQGPPKREEAPAHADRALALAGQVPFREENFIRGSHAMFKGDYAKAKQFFEALFTVHPDHYWAGNNLMYLYRVTGERWKVRAVMEKMLESRPNDPRAYFLLSRECLCPPEEMRGRAMELGEKAVELGRAQMDAQLQRTYSIRHLDTRAILAWLAGDLSRTRNLLEEMGRHDLVPGDYELYSLALGYMTLGQFRDADQVIQRLLPPMRARYRMWRALLSGDKAAAAKQANELEKVPPHPQNAILLVRAGRLGSAIRIMSQIKDGAVGFAPAAITEARAEVLLSQGRMEEAAGMAAPVALNKNANDITEYLFAAQTAAKALAAQGRHKEAAAILEETTASPRACGWWEAALFWLYARFDLLQLYRGMNQPQVADAIHKELAGLLAFADEDHPLRIALRREAANVSSAR